MIDFIPLIFVLVGKGWLGGVKAKGGVNMAEMSTVLHDAKVNKPCHFTLNIIDINCKQKN